MHLKLPYKYLGAILVLMWWRRDLLKFVHVCVVSVVAPLLLLVLERKV